MGLVGEPEEVTGAGHDDPPVVMRELVVHGYRRAFRVDGHGPALLLIHGIGDSSATWAHLLPALATRFTVIAPDLLGHGMSAKPRADYAAAAYACGLRDLLTLLGIPRATVVGHSLGGGVAMQFAYQFPERCERLVLVGSGGFGREVHLLLRAATAPGSEALLPVVTSPTGQFLGRVLAGAGSWSPLRLTGLGDDLLYVLGRYHELADVDARRVFLRTLRSVVDHAGQVVTVADRAYLFDGIPTLLIWGSADRIVPVAHAYRAQQVIPGSVLEIFEGVGHFPHHADPERFLTLLERFHADTAPAHHLPSRWQRLLRRGPLTDGPASPSGS